MTVWILGQGGIESVSMILARGAHEPRTVHSSVPYLRVFMWKRKDPIWSTYPKSLCLPAPDCSRTVNVLLKEKAIKSENISSLFM